MNLQERHIKRLEGICFDLDLRIESQPLSKGVKYVLKDNVVTYVTQVLRNAKQGVLYFGKDTYALKADDVRTFAQEMRQFLEEQEQETPAYDRICRAESAIRRLIEGTPVSSRLTESCSELACIPDFETLQLLPVEELEKIMQKLSMRGDKLVLGNRIRIRNMEELYKLTDQEGQILFNRIAQYKTGEQASERFKQSLGF
ncbi:hypothetical protein KY329_03720 [Candidatus Woesearchaeota archaeon]|nr:hypothetical protein [Candidatus Woesearchaeota archaeon]